MSVRARASGRLPRLTLASVGAMGAAQAVLWFRIAAQAFGHRPGMLALAVAALLAGTAGGLRWWGVRAARPAEHRAALFVSATGVLLYSALPLVASAMTQRAALGRTMLWLAMAAASACTGAALRWLVECARRESTVDPMGARALATALAGAAVGAPITRYFLLDLESLEHSVLVVAVAALVLAQVLWWSAPTARRAGLTALGLAALTMLLAQDRLFAGVLERLHFGAGSREVAYRTVVQGRDGVVGVTADGQAYADGLYLDAYATDPESNSNLISRAYFVGALHRAPRRVLQLGFGSGAWTRILADTRGVDSVTVVEPSVAVLEAVWRHRDIASVLDDARVRLYTEHPRRWLARHPDARYDVIVVNAPWHWRDGATLQLSAEFLRAVRGHLAPAGVAYIATTGSLDVMYTVSGVWRHVVRVANSVAASDAPFAQTREERRAALLGVLGADGQPRIRGARADATLEAMLNGASGELAPALRRANDLWNITDDNLASEYKTAGAGAWWRALPARLWRPDRAWPTVLF